MENEKRNSQSFINGNEPIQKARIDREATYQLLGKKTVASLLENYFGQKEPLVAETRPTDIVSKLTPEPVPALPEKAPEKWSERTAGRTENPVTFINRVYAPWLGKGLTRPHLNQLDHSLYVAHAKWQKRHLKDPQTTELQQLMPNRSEVTTQRIERALTDPAATDRLAAAQALATREYRRRILSSEPKAVSEQAEDVPNDQVK
jgi:hypothetical protein